MIYDFFQATKSLNKFTSGCRVGHRTSNTTETITDDSIATGSQVGIRDDNTDTTPNARLAGTVTILSFQKDNKYLSGSGNLRQSCAIPSLTSSGSFCGFFLIECRESITELETVLYRLVDNSGATTLLGFYSDVSTGEIFLSKTSDRSDKILTGVTLDRFGRYLVNFSFDGISIKVWINNVVVVDQSFSGLGYTGNGFIIAGGHETGAGFSVYTQTEYTNGTATLNFKTSLPANTPSSGYMMVDKIPVSYTGKTSTSITGVTWDVLGYYGFSKVKSSASSSYIKSAALVGYIQAVGFGEGTTLSDTDVDLMYLNTGYDFTRVPKAVLTRLKPNTIFTRKASDDDILYTDSAEQVARLVEAQNTTHAWITSKAWINTNTFTFAIAEAEESTPLGSFTPREGDRMDGNGRLTMRFKASNVRVPKTALVGKGDGQYADGELVVWDKYRDSLYDAYHAEIIQQGTDVDPPTIEVGLAGIVGSVSSSLGYYSDDGSRTRAGLDNAGGWGGSATAIRYDAGQVTIDEFLKGQVNHVVSISVPVVASGIGYVYPAQSRDATTLPSTDIEDNYGVLEGALFKLPKDFDSTGITNKATLLLIQAAKDYGLCVRDRAGNLVAMYLEDATQFIADNGYDPYEGQLPTVNGTKVPDFPWDQLQMVDPTYLENSEWNNITVSGDVDVNSLSYTPNVNQLVRITPTMIVPRESTTKSIKITNKSISNIYYGQSIQDCVKGLVYIAPDETIEFKGYSGELLLRADIDYSTVSVSVAKN